MGYYRRERYLRRMRAFYHDDGLIKVVTGVRRCGKSCLMVTVAEELSESGVDASRIIFVDLDAKANRKVRTPDALEELIDSELPPASGTRYLFIDEVQNVKGFEEVVNGYRTDGGVSIFITGSNSYLLSGELATKLTGRYIEFDMGTLDFSEYLGMKRHLGKPVDANLDAEFNRYILEGGFPKTVEYDELADKRAYVRGVIDEIFEKDVRRNRKIRHVSVFNAVRDYLVNNFGATTSVTNLLAHFNDRERIPIKRETLNRYIQVLVDAKVLNRCERFDMKSKQSLAREEKYYVADLGFYFALNTDNRVSYGSVLENIVYQHARTMGYAVSVGKIGRLECDFVLRRPDMGYAYVQVAMTIADEATEEREFRSLEAARDNWPKYLLTMDRLLQRRGGVLHENVVDFLAEDRPF